MIFRVDFGIEKVQMRERERERERRFEIVAMRFSGADRELDL